jgi:putative restriction endonuclease
MENDVQRLRRHLIETEFRCVPPGAQDTSDVYEHVRSAYPELCDDDYLCKDAHDGGTDQPEWKHTVRNAQQELNRRDHSRVQRRDGEWFYAHPCLYLQPVNEDWIDRFRRTVRSEVTADYAPDVPGELSGLLPARIWGVTDAEEGSAKRSHIDRLCPGDLLLYYHDGGFVATARVGRCLESPAVGEWLWNSPESRWIQLLTDFRDRGPPIDAVWEALGYDGRQVVQGFLRVNDDRIEELRDRYGSLEVAILQHGVEGDPDGRALVDGIDPDSPGRRTTVVDQLRRDRALVEELKQTYDHRCQVCGDRREQADGDGYAEAHHIRPLGEPHSGPDVAGNVLVLCPNHHADFDNGRLRVDPDSLAIDHRYDERVDGDRLRTERGHEIDSVYLRYHNQEIADR